jgi:hypothetical protein
LRIGTTGFESFHRGRREHRIDSAPMERLGTRVRGGPLYGFWLICNHLYKFFAEKYFSWFEKYDVVFYETDTMLNPAAYLAYHFPALSRYFPAGRRFGLMSAIFGSPKRTLIFYLDVDPKVSMERCTKRDAQGNGAIEPHQTLQTMEMLRREFSKITQAAIAKGYTLLAIDTTQLTLDQVTAQAEAALRKRLTSQTQLNA